MPRQTEVEDLGVTVLRQKDVLGLDVAVDDPLLVGGREPLRNLPRDVERTAGGSGPFAMAIRSVSPSRSSLTANRTPPSSPTSKSARMLGCESAATARASLAKRASASALAGEPLGQDLDRDVALQPGVPRAVDLAHAARHREGRRSRTGRAWFLP